MSNGTKVTILRDTNNNLAAFNKLEPKEARVIAIQRGVSQSRTILFENGTHDFTILYESIKFGVSTNLKKYKRVTVKNKRFFVFDNNESKPIIRQATVQMFHQTYVNYNEDTTDTRSEQDIL